MTAPVTPYRQGMTQEPVIFGGVNALSVYVRFFRYRVKQKKEDFVINSQKNLGRFN